MLRRFVFLLLRYSLTPFLSRELGQRKRVTILVYHRPNPDTAALHFRTLRRAYNIISLRDFLKARSNGTCRRLPPKALIVTFDDGDKSNYLLKSVLERYQIPATFFLCSGIVGTKRHFWFNTDITDGDRQSLKRLPNEERLEALRKIGFSEAEECPTRQALSGPEIEELRTVVDLQSHTVYHPILLRCSSERSFWEIAQSRTDLQSNFGLKIYALAYPNGDYSKREIEFAKAAGYECALTMEFGLNSDRTPLFQLRRICVNDDASASELIVKASGVWGFLKERLYSKKPALDPINDALRASA
jgi:peptidoglycan/xylan/chitin deacetylase (PgdA/CDA1 family)